MDKDNGKSKKRAASEREVEVEKEEEEDDFMRNPGEKKCDMREGERERKMCHTLSALSY